MRKIFTQGKAYLHRMLSYSVACLLLTSAASSAIAQPIFTGGRHQTLHTCDNVSQELATMLAVSDPAMGVALTWTVINVPAGFTIGTATGTSTTGAPISFLYVPVAGSSSDLVSVVVSDGAHMDTTDIAISVTPITAVTIGPATTDVCPGETATVNIVGPAGAVVTYLYELQDLAGTSATGIFDSTRTITLDGSGHAVIPVVTTDVHAGETSEAGYNFTSYYYTLLSAESGSCTASYTPDNTAMVSANYVYAYWESTGRTFDIDEPGTRYICAGSQDTLRLHAPGDAVAVVKFTNLHTMAVSYDTITVPHTGIYDIYTGPITDSISYTVVALSSAGCDKMLMDRYIIKFKRLYPASITMNTITGSAYPDDIEDVYPEGPFAPTCTGTHRNLRLEFDGVSVLPSWSTGYTPYLTYTINGGAPHNIDIVGPSPMAIINTGIITTDQDYHFISITDDAGCTTPISDSFFIPILEYPSATFSVTPAACAGDSVTLTVTGTPTQLFFMYTNGVGSLHQIDSSGVFTLGAGSLDTTIQYILEAGYYEHEGNCMTMYNDTTHVVVSHAPVGTIISSSSSICVGSSISLTANNLGGSWTLSNANASLSGGVLTGVTAGTTTLTYIVGNACGVDTAIQMVSVLAAPVAATLSGVGAVCEGASITLTASVGGGLWASGAATIATVSSGGGVSGIGSGVTLISYTVSNICGIAVASMPVTVNPMPLVGAITGSSNVCVDGTITLANATTGGAWSSSNVFRAIVSATSGVLYGMSAGSVAISYSVTNSCGTAVVTHMVTVNPLPVSTPISGDDEVCAGSSITLNNVTTGGTWSSSATAVATVDATGIVWGTAPGVATITYTISNIYGCSISPVASVTVHPTPVLSPISGPAAVAVLSTVAMMDTATGGTWSSSDVTLASIDAATGNVTGVAMGTVTITYIKTNGWGCTATETRELIVAGSLSSTELLTTGAMTMCHGNPVTLGTATAGGATDLSFQWLVDGVVVPGATGSSHIATVAGYYSVIISNLAGSDTIAGVTVLPALNAVITLTGTSTLNTGTFNTYQWYRNGVVIGGATSGSYTATASGNYYVVVSDTTGCTDTSAVYILTPDGIADGSISSGNSIKLYPNPAINNLYIDAPFAVDVKVTGADGRVVANIKNAEQIDMRDMPAGIYIVMIYYKQGSLLRAEKVTKSE